jgi:hypothetical protein
VAPADIVECLILKGEDPGGVVTVEVGEGPVDDDMLTGDIL